MPMFNDTATDAFWLPNALRRGVPLRIVVGGVTYERLTGANGQFLTGADGLPSYGRI